MKKDSFIKNIILIITSNILSIFLGVAISFILPRLLGSVEDYAYWQLYVFYTGYAGIFLFGFNDGMNLIYAGKELTDQRDRTKITAFILFVMITTAIMSTIAIVILMFTNMDIKYKITYIFIFLNIFIFNVNGFALHINQMTLRFKAYARFNVFERILFTVSFAPLFFFKADKFYVYIGINVVIRIITLILNVMSIRDIILIRKLSLRSVIVNKGLIKQCIVSGFPLTMSTILSMLIVTSPRLIVEYNFSLYDYGLFSFAFSSLSIVIQVVAALATVLYPTMKRLDSSSYEDINANFKIFVTYVCSVSLLAYFFILPIVEHFLPQYIEIGKYLHLLFPWIIYQCINSINISVFYRLVRLEKKLLSNNIFGVVLVFLLEYLSFFTFGKIEAVILAGLIAMSIWTRFNYNYLLSKMMWKTKLSDNLDIVFVSGFLIITIFIKNNYIAFTSYLLYLIILSVILYLFNKNEIRDFINIFKRG